MGDVRACRARGSIGHPGEVRDRGSNDSGVSGDRGSNDSGEVRDRGSMAVLTVLVVLGVAVASMTALIPHLVAIGDRQRRPERRRRRRARRCGGGPRRVGAPGGVQRRGRDLLGPRRVRGDGVRPRRRPGRRGAGDERTVTACPSRPSTATPRIARHERRRADAYTRRGEHRRRRPFLAVVRRARCDLHEWPRASDR